MGRFVTRHGDWVADIGYIEIYSSDYNDRHIIINSLLKQLILYRAKIGMDQFCSGMNAVGKLFDIVKENHTPFTTLFTSHDIVMTRHHFKSLYKIEWSVEGSNNREKEEETVYAFETYLQEVEEKKHPVSLEDILVFITAADRVPVLGFPKAVTVSFYTCDDNETRFPSASTCDLRLWLPRDTELERLTELMNRALLESHGFGKI
ncbi:G2/M phase-specific E3 ubiquitin-protein ligase-like [Ptychodera flava]|uniref:G2/M phase-specific E3 ubiquitin-protein ligase-like n=1 Tax=Ptychodera flava TaxID=63121 RepID=UPI00396A3643